MKHLRLLALLAALFIASAPRAHADDSASGLEYRVKAVVLFNFAKYVHWPEKAFQSPTQSINVCILGKDPFGDVFQSSDAPKEAQNRPLKVVELGSSPKKEEVASCQLLFWQHENEAAVKALATTIQEHAVLTVADETSENSLISFLVQDAKVRFRIRRKAAEALGFDISSQLLKLAILDE